VAQGTINRLTYERLGILLTNAPAYKEQGSKYADLVRVQSMSYGFSHKAIDVKGVGSDKLFTRNGQSPVIQAPDVNCNIEYLFCEGQNESRAGLYIGERSSILKNFISSSTTDDINIIVVASDKDSNRDVNFLKNEQDFNDYNIIGFGNSFLTNYTYKASVGSLPSCSMSYSSSNLRFDIYDQLNRPKFPSVKLGVNNLPSVEELALVPGSFSGSGSAVGEQHIFDDHYIPEISAIRPGDVKIIMTKISGSRGGARLDYIYAAIQNIEINLPIPRQDIYGMGSNYIFNRKLKLPIVGQLSVDMVLRGYSQTQVNSFLTESDVFELKIDQPVSPRMEGEQGDIYIDKAKSRVYFSIEKNLWKSAGFVIENMGAGVEGGEYISSDSNFFYMFIQGVEWAKITLTPSSFSRQGGQVGEKVASSHFIYVFSLMGWRKFPVTDVDFESLVFNEAVQIGNNITFEINRAQLRSQEYSHSIGSDVMVSSSFSFDVTEKDGLSLYFRYVSKVPPSWGVSSEVLEYLEGETYPIECDSSIDLGDSAVTFSLRGDDPDKFNVSDQGIISFKSSPDFETKQSYHVVIVAANDAGEDFKDISINIINVVESPPSWGVQHQEVSYIENDSASVSYLFDVDGGDGNFTLSLLGDDYHQFSITQDGVINFLSSPDFETQDLYSIKVVATNDAGTGIKDLSINIIDIPDIAPVWDIASEVVSYTENDTTSLVYDTGINPGDRSITSYIVSGDHSGDFLIDSSNGVINFLSSPDFETQDLYSIKVVATNDAGTGIKDLSVSINNVVDFLPEWGDDFENINYSGANLNVVEFINDVDPVDVGGSITGYQLSGLDANAFSLIDSSGTIAFNEVPDYQDRSSYSIDVVAFNEFGSASKELNIEIVGRMFFENHYLVVEVNEFETKQTVFTREVRQSSTTLSQEVSLDDNFYYVCISGNNWAKIALIDSNFSFVGFPVGSKVFRSDFVHVYTSSGWKKFAVTFMSRFFFQDSQLVLQINEFEVRRLDFEVEVRAAANTLTQEIGISDDFYYVCISGTNWAKIALADSPLDLVGYSIGYKIVTSDFVHVFTASGWKRFAITL